MSQGTGEDSAYAGPRTLSSSFIIILFYMDTVFYISVEFLLLLATILGCTYNEINVWIFCILGPAVFLGLVIWNLKLKRKIKTLINGND